VLGPLLFTCYISLISSIASSFDVSIQQYVDDTHIYIALTTTDVTAHLTRLSSCLSVLHGSVITALNLIAANQSPFCLAPDNVFATSLQFLYTYYRRLQKFHSPITSKPWVWLSMLISHSTNTSHHSVNRCIFIPRHCAIFALHYLTIHRVQIRHGVHGHHISYLVSSIPSRLCKFSLLHGTSAANIHKLQCAQNSLPYLVRVVLSGRHREHLSACMRLSNVHCRLPVSKRIDFKLALTTYKILSTYQPAYLRWLLFPYEPTWAVRSSSQQLLNVPTVTSDFGRRAFSYCASKIWNEIPAAIRNAPAVQTFKHRLKTHLFSLMNDP